MSQNVTYRCWCEREGCDWTANDTVNSRVVAQKSSSGEMMAHGIAEGHHETKRSIDTKTDSELRTDGGQEIWVADCEDCGFRAVYDTGNMTRTVEERAKGGAGGHRSTYPDHDIDVRRDDDADVHRCDICDTRFPTLGDLLTHECDDHRDAATLVTDGAGDMHRASVDAVQVEAGVGDQDTTCENGVEGCPGPAGKWTRTCHACFIGGGDGE